jgi:hypothetical protein
MRSPPGSECAKHPGGQRAAASGIGPLPWGRACAVLRVRDLLIEADLRTFVECGRGFRDLKLQVRAGNVRIAGPRELKKAFPNWLMLSSLASYPRRRAGREERLSKP